MASSNTLLVIAGIWLALGLVVATALSRQGHPPPTALAAIVAWPAMIPLLGPGETPSAGPFSPRIHSAFSALRAALTDPALAGVSDAPTLAAVESALHRADARIAAVDRLLADEALAADPESTRLREARARAATEVDTVLHQVLTLRVQLGLVALAGDTRSVRAHLSALAAQARALEEVAAC